MNSLRRYPPHRRADAATAESNSRRGRSSVRAGKQFEEQLDECHEAYMRLGRACITHAPPRTVGAPGRMRFKEASDVDYAGHYAGAPVAFDAKSWTDKASYRLPSPTENGGKDLARHLRQIEWLRKFAETGQRGNATAFFLLHCSKLDVCWVLDLTLLHHLSRNPTKSIPIRTLNRDGTITHHLPHVPEAPTLAIAQGQPRWDFLHVAFSA